IRTRPLCGPTSSRTTAGRPMSAAVPERSIGGCLMCRSANGRATPRPRAEAITKIPNWIAASPPKNPAPAASSAATPTSPNASVVVMISATPSTTATISQITHALTAALRCRITLYGESIPVRRGSHPPSAMGNVAATPSRPLPSSRPPPARSRSRWAVRLPRSGGTCHAPRACRAGGAGTTRESARRRHPSGIGARGRHRQQTRSRARPGRPAARNRLRSRRACRRRSRNARGWRPTPNRAGCRRPGRAMSTGHRTRVRSSWLRRRSRTARRLPRRVVAVRESPARLAPVAPAAPHKGSSWHPTLRRRHPAAKAVTGQLVSRNRQARRDYGREAKEAMMTAEHLSYSHGASAHPLLGQTIGDNLRQTAGQYPGSDALVDVPTGRRWSYAQLDADTDDLASGLLTLGIEKGDRVGIWAPHCPEWVLLQYATAKIGAILVNINPAYRSHELGYVLRQSEIRLLVSAEGFKTSDYRAMIGEVAGEAPDLERVIYLGTPGWDELVAAGAAAGSAAVASRSATLAFDDPINIQYTSGTTGFPKGATLSHHNILNNGFFI